MLKGVFVFVVLVEKGCDLLYWKRIFRVTIVKNVGTF